MATQIDPIKSKPLEQEADEFLRDHLRTHPGLETIQVQCLVDKRQAHVASHDDVTTFISTLKQDVIRHDATETDTDVPLNVQPVEPEVDLNLAKESSKPMILAKQISKHRTVFFAGIQGRTKKLLWAYDIRLAHVFLGAEREICERAFQFSDDGEILQETFSGLGLQLLPAPSKPSF